MPQSAVKYLPTRYSGNCSTPSRFADSIMHAVIDTIVISKLRLVLDLVSSLRLTPWSLHGGSQISSLKLNFNWHPAGPQPRGTLLRSHLTRARFQLLLRLFADFIACAD
eukprot:6202355-Pleurochrysis_carterae.AAC.5